VTTSFQLAGKIGGLSRAARYTRAELGAQSAAGWRRRFDGQVPDDVTDPADRQRMAEAMKAVYFTRLAVKCNATRAAKKAARADAIAKIVEETLHG
jgi:predicted secreted protein